MHGSEQSGLTYAQAGVDITAGSQAVELIKKHVRSTFRPGVINDIGGFGGLFALDAARYREPVLVAGTDGVGTKLSVAMMMDRHDTIGIDAVAMCVNDVVVQGAEPLFFLDYLAVGKLVPEKVAAIVKGVSDGCREAGCALIGGETAEMPGFYGLEEYDIAGFCVGVVDRPAIIDGSSITAGDRLIGLGSSGLHSNGYSLVRKALLELAGMALDRQVEELGTTLGEALLTPTRIYVKPILRVLGSFPVLGMAHITGGGLVENIPRILPAGLSAFMEAGSWSVPPIFELVRRAGGVSTQEMHRTLNMGIGMVLVVRAADVDGVTAVLRECGETPFLIGEVGPGDGGVVLR